MKKNYERIVLLLLSALLSVGFLAGCSDADNGDDGYLLKKEDISVNRPDGGFKALVNEPFRIEVKSVSDEGVSYEWSLGDSKIADSKNLEYTFTSLGTFTLTLHASQGTTTFDYDFEVKVTTDYILKKEDITIEEPEGGFRAKVDQLFRIEVTSLRAGDQRHGHRPGARLRLPGDRFAVVGDDPPRPEQRRGLPGDGHRARKRPADRNGGEPHALRPDLYRGAGGNQPRLI